MVYLVINYLQRKVNVFGAVNRNDKNSMYRISPLDIGFIYNCFVMSIILLHRQPINPILSKLCQELRLLKLHFSVFLLDLSNCCHYILPH